MDITFIYSLSHPITDEVRYIGKSDKPLSRRISEHISNVKYKKPKSHKDCWIKSLLLNGLKPKIEIIDEVLEKEWEFWEKHYVSLYKSWGFYLTNGDEGGRGGTKKSLKTRENMSIAQKMKPSPSQEIRDRISKTLTGRVGANKGRKFDKINYEKGMQTRIKNGNIKIMSRGICKCCLKSFEFYAKHSIQVYCSKSCKQKNIHPKGTPSPHKGKKFDKITRKYVAIDFNSHCNK